MIKEFLRQIIGPLRSILIEIYTNYKLLKKNKTLKLSGKVRIRNTIFGRCNFVQDSIINNTYLGDYSYVAKGSEINNCTIGKYCCIAPNVKIGLGEHPVKDFVSIHPVFYTDTAHLGYSFTNENYFKEYYDTTIGNDVWIGANVIIKGGVKIGDGVIIASGAIVTKDVDAFSIVGGVPAKFIKTRFEPNEIVFLKEYKWWDRDYDFLKNNHLLFHDIKKFINGNTSK